MTIDDKVLDAIRAGVHRNMLICSHTGLDFRKVDPALQRLRRAGKIELRRPEGWFAREATEHAQQLAAAKDAVIEAAVAMTDREAERVARAFHEAYERLAPSFGYETRRESAAPWESVPDQNRALMTAVCAEVMAPLLASREAAARAGAIAEVGAALPFARAPHSFIRIVAGAVKQTLGEVRGNIGKQHAGVLTQRIASRALAAMRGERGDEAELPPIPPPPSAGVGAECQGGAPAQAAAPGEDPARQGIRGDVALSPTPPDRVVVAREDLAVLVDVAGGVLDRLADEGREDQESGPQIRAALARLGESDGR